MTFLLLRRYQKVSQKVWRRNLTRNDFNRKKSLYGSNTRLCEKVTHLDVVHHPLKIIG